MGRSVRRRSFSGSALHSKALLRRKGEQHLEELQGSKRGHRLPSSGARKKRRRTRTEEGCREGYRTDQAPPAKASLYASGKLSLRAGGHREVASILSKALADSTVLFRTTL